MHDLGHDRDELVYTMTNWTSAVDQHFKAFVNVPHILTHFSKSNHRPWNAPLDYDRNF